jgi:hypothetical protein
MLAFQVSDLVEVFRSNKHRYEKDKNSAYYCFAHDSPCLPGARCQSLKNDILSNIGVWYGKD